jgi:hypothetical protein
MATRKQKSICGKRKVTAVKDGVGVKEAVPKETPGNNGYIPVEKISPLPSNSAERARPKSRKKHSASGVVLTGTPHKESLNGLTQLGFGELIRRG